MSLIYKILPRAEWTAAEARGEFTGSGIDLADGYIHFSDAKALGLKYADVKCGPPFGATHQR